MFSAGCLSTNQEAVISAETMGIEVCQKELGQRGRLGDCIVDQQKSADFHFKTVDNIL